MAQRKPPQSVLDYINHIKKHYADVQKVYMFGSYAKEYAHVDSDIDIAVVFNKVLDSFDLQVELMKLRRRYDIRIEPHVFKAADFTESHPLADEILKTGVMI